MNEVNSAPDPVLGLHVDEVAAQRKQRLVPFARAGMNFCIASATAFAAMSITAATAMWHGAELPKDSSDNVMVLLTTVLWVTLSTWLVCQLVGISLCICARKSRVVKAALVMALVLIPDTIALLVKINSVMVDRANHLN